MSVGVTGTFGVTGAFGVIGAFDVIGAFGVIGALEKSAEWRAFLCALVRRDEGREWDRGAICEGCGGVLA